ncbi:type VI secretion system protein ImpA [Variovorax sp. TBS-050B]|uniref:type VI secretion system protein TssA n=1 Tax=Variovorax sp. TBS-050B TaxID=2940551 RepID=UPI002474A8C5|nr:type VI secretion system protein TssA [Variovorax sp. TBS-050B]MDH6592244.1 type VI secretion system protein ImpA [Variovorax sp. TBS-050B]
MPPREIELLQSPVEGPLPCGEDLEYDPEFLALQQAATGKREQQFGATIIPAEPPDWARVERLAKALCQRTLDVRVLVLLTLAWTETQGLPGYVDGLRVVEGVLQKFWDDVHPRVVDDGFEDPLPRMNALAALAEAEGLGRSVRDARLLEDGGASMSLRQVEALLDSSKADQIDYPGGIGRLREVARRAQEKGAPPVVALHAALELLQRIREIAERALGQSWAPDFSRLERSLRTVVQLLPEQAQPASAEASEAATAGEGSAEGASASGPAQAGGPASGASGLRVTSVKDIEISSRDDVQVLLEKACQFMERTEPSHPAPMLIRRAQRLLDLNFFQIIEELVPEGVQKIESLAGRSLSAGSAAD